MFRQVWMLYIQVRTEVYFSAESVHRISGEHPVKMLLPVVNPTKIGKYPENPNIREIASRHEEKIIKLFLWSPVF